MNPFRLYMRYTRWNARLTWKLWTQHPVAMLTVNAAVFFGIVMYYENKEITSS